MTTSIDLSWDGGTTDGDPGQGRIRLDAMRLKDARHFLINDQDRHENRLGELLGQFRTGDVLGLEREGPEGQIIAWVIGQTVHRGGYYRVPIKVRSVRGGFAGHDLVILHRLEEDALITATSQSVDPTSEIKSPQVISAAPMISPANSPEPAANSPLPPVVAEPVIPPRAFPPTTRTELATLKQQAIDTMADPTPVLNRIATIEAHLELEVAVEFAIRAQNEMVDRATREFSRGFIAAEARALGKDPDAYIRELITARASRQAQIMGERLKRLQG